MKKTISALILALTLFTFSAAQALDPHTPKNRRNIGMLNVQSPKASDVITATNTANTSDTRTIVQNTVTDLPVGTYQINVTMDGNQKYSQTVTIEPTERFDVVVPGFGNLKVNGVADLVTVFQTGTQTKVAEFKGSDTYTLPRGFYDVVIQSGKHSIPMKNIQIITNETRQLDIGSDTPKGKGL